MPCSGISKKQVRERLRSLLFLVFKKRKTPLARQGSTDRVYGTALFYTVMRI